MVVKVNVLGMAAAIKILSRKSKKTKQGAIEGMTKATLFLQNEVKLSIAGHRAEPTSVDTGRFLNSVQSKALCQT